MGGGGLSEGSETEIDFGEPCSLDDIGTMSQKGSSVVLSELVGGLCWTLGLVHGLCGELPWLDWLLFSNQNRR